MLRRTLLWTIVLLFAAVGALRDAEAGAGAKVGHRAPWFSLKTLGGESFSRRKLDGRPALLVVGRTQKAAPPCKRWMLKLLSRLRPAVPTYQVIVVDKAWYIPRGAVISKIEGFTPERWRHRVLVEWYTVFADTWGVARHDDPVVFLLDRRGVVRWRRRGPLTKSGLASLMGALKRF
jgi:hypothetical protein